jgi:hypothetical protein
MARLLVEHPAFALDLDLGKSLIFKKLADARDLGEWVNQPYVVRRSNDYARHPNAYTLQDFHEPQWPKMVYWLGRRLPQGVRQRVKRMAFQR